VPDDNWCLSGSEFWIEYKKSEANVLSHNLSPHQIGWIERRLRAGGRVFVAVRLQWGSGPRRGAAMDALLLYHGREARALALGGLSGAGKPLGRWEGGPARWDWPEIEALLVKTKFQG